MTRFRPASLDIGAIPAQAAIHQRQALHKMTKDSSLQDVYGTALDRIKQQDGSKSKLGMEALMWISHSKRPLKSEELCHALGVEIGEEDLNIRNVPSIRTVLGCTLGLVTIDEEASTVGLLDFALQEYLKQHPTLFVTAHSTMAEICLTYLNYRSVRALPYTLEKTAPFLEYATCFWGIHAARGITEPVKALALRLLDGYENHLSATVLWRRKLDKRGLVQDFRGISGLHCIAFWGIAEIGISMLETKRWQVNGRDCRGETPLMWAVRYKNHRIMELFLKQEDIEPDTFIKDDRAVFSFAAESGNKDAVKLLLARGDVDPNSPDSNGRTPLLFAVSGRHEGVVKLLLERGDVNPNSLDSKGRTPLLFAVSGGHEGVVKLLLERGDVNPNSLDSKGRTPLLFAVSEGHEGVVKLLLERGDVNPNSLDGKGRTPLFFAVSGGHEGVVRVLLERGDINPNSLDCKGRTPLLFAISEGHEGVVKLLLERGDVNPNSPDINGLTPLLFAAERLPGRGDTNSYLPLPSRIRRYFATSRHEALMKLLLEREDVDPNSSGRDGRTPLSYAAERGHEDVVKLLLERRDVNSNSRENLQNTSESRALPTKYHQCFFMPANCNVSPFAKKTIFIF